MAGRSMVKREPLPSSLSTVIVPPISRQRFWLSERPRPVPPYFAAIVGLACVKLENRLACCSRLMPTPVSATDDLDPVAVGPPLAVDRSVIWPFWVNLAALLSRLKMACRSLVASARTLPRSGPRSTTKALVFLAASGRAVDLDLVDELVEVDVLEVQLHLAGLDLGDVEDVVDHRQQMLAGGADLLQVGDLLAAALKLGILEQDLAVAEHRVERGAQLVAHLGQEVGLGAVGALGFVLGDGQLLHVSAGGGRSPAAARTGESTTRE